MQAMTPKEERIEQIHDKIMDVYWHQGGELSEVFRSIAEIIFELEEKIDSLDKKVSFITNIDRFKINDNRS